MLTQTEVLWAKMIHYISSYTSLSDLYCTVEDQKAKY